MIQCRIRAFFDLAPNKVSQMYHINELSDMLVFKFNTWKVDCFFFSCYLFDEVKYQKESCFFLRNWYCFELFRLMLRCLRA